MPGIGAERVLPCAALRCFETASVLIYARQNERSVSRGSGIIGRQRQAGKLAAAIQPTIVCSPSDPRRTGSPNTGRQSKANGRRGRPAGGPRRVAWRQSPPTPDDAVPFEPNQRHGPHGTHSEGQTGKTSHDDRMTQPPTPAGASRLRLHRPRPLPPSTASLIIVALAAQPG
jgi:hypothetical protein